MRSNVFALALTTGSSARPRAQGPEKDQICVRLDTSEQTVRGERTADVTH